MGGGKMWNKKRRQLQVALQQMPNIKEETVKVKIQGHYKKIWLRYKRIGTLSVSEAGEMELAVDNCQEVKQKENQK